MKLKQYPFGILLVMLGLTFGVISPSVLAEGLLPPQLAIEDASNQMKVKLQGSDFKDDFAQVTSFVEEVIYPHVDFKRISALVLGKYWKTASKEQRKDFSIEFKILLVRTYSRAFLNFKEWSVHFLPIKLAADSDKVIVKTEVLQPGKQPIAVNYRMALVGEKWKVYDIIIEGVSLVTNYRTSFKNEVKRAGSLDAVIAKMAQRNLEALDPTNEKS